MGTLSGNYYGGIVKDGLVLLLDAAKKDSYDRLGTTWRDISFNGNQFNWSYTISCYVTTSTTTGLDYFSIGGISEIGPYDEQYTGYFGELIIFNEFHSLSTHNSIVNFLKERWGIT